jgi:UDP-N-acetylglucosamine acyltransferase
MNVHPSAIIDPRAKVPASCKVGPYCVIGADVELGEDCRLSSHVAIEGPTKIGADNAFFSVLRDRDGAAGCDLQSRADAA